MAQASDKRLWGSVADWVAMSGDSERRVRDQIASGELRAVKEGKRISIDLEHARARKQRLPSARKAP